MLIAVRSDLDIISKEIKMGSGAEMIAVELTTPSGAKLIICTCYRVGTLGIENLSKVKSALQTLSRRRNLSKIYVVGTVQLCAN